MAGWPLTVIRTIDIAVEGPEADGALNELVANGFHEEG